MAVWVDGWVLQRRGDVIEVGDEVEWSLVASTTPVHGYIVRTLGETVGTSFSECVFLRDEVNEQPPVATRAHVASIVAAYWQVELPPRTRDARAVEGSGILEAVGRASGQEPEKDGMGFYGYLVELTPMP